MISLRKALFTLLAPLGAATIIGTGFATWVFGIQGVPVDGGPVNNNVAVTPEVKNGDIKILSCPNLIVFSEGTQGASNLSDGINFYTNKVVSQGKEFAISMDDKNFSHRLSLVYDNTTNPKKMYFSWKKDEKSNVIAGELKKTTSSQIRNDDNYIGTWTGSVVSESQTLSVTLVLDEVNEAKNGTLTFENNQVIEYESEFTFEERTSITDNITVTDSTFSFRYTYKNPDLINEKNTRYHLNVKMKLALESSNYPFEFIDGGTELVYEKGGPGSPGYVNFVLSSPNNSHENYELSFNLNSYKLNFIMDDIPPKTGKEVFPYGKYLGFSEGTRIPCTLNYYSSATGENNASITVGAMDHFLKIPDKFTSHCDEKGYFNIFDGDNEYYAQTNLNFDINKHLDTNGEGPYYIDFTCQLANFLTYDSPDVKPIDFDKYVGLYIASILGEWTYKITVSADFTEIRG